MDDIKLGNSLPSTDIELDELIINIEMHSHKEFEGNALKQLYLMKNIKKKVVNFINATYEMVEKMRKEIEGNVEINFIQTVKVMTENNEWEYMRIEDIPSEVKFLQLYNPLYYDQIMKTNPRFFEQIEVISAALYFMKEEKKTIDFEPFINCKTIFGTFNKVNVIYPKNIEHLIIQTYETNPIDFGFVFLCFKSNCANIASDAKLAQLQTICRTKNLHNCKQYVGRKTCTTANIASDAKLAQLQTLRRTQNLHNCKHCVGHKTCITTK